MILEAVIETNHHVQNGKFLINPSLEESYNINGTGLYALSKLDNFLAPVQPVNHRIPPMNKVCEYFGALLYPAEYNTKNLLYGQENSSTISNRTVT